MTSLIIHGHFYQPPRENLWTGIIQEQPSAAPFHDWNERIYAECYGPNAFATISDKKSGETRTLNNYANISFNFGPTLLSWLEVHHPETYSRIIAADRESATKHHGHGNAIAQAYGHAILPLCNARDLRTQIRWGLADFRHRFGRTAESIWLPETACNDAVLGALIDEGLRFVILAPHQAARFRIPTRPDSEQRNEVNTGSGSDWLETSLDENEWQLVNESTIDTSLPYLYRSHDNRDKSIAVFFYDGPTSRGIAFDNLLRSSRELVDALRRSANGKPMISVATDGETYGHHFKFGDICLAHTVAVEAPAGGFRITNFGEYLEAHPATMEVQINSGPDSQGTSWSCVHGIARWSEDCGCHTGGEPGWNQQWREPLRRAFDFLRDQNVAHFEATRRKLFIDPWQARDDGIVLNLDPYYSREQFLFEQAGRWLSADEQQAALTYLELQRLLLLMYTSCGWFFSDLGGIETIQVLSYAAGAIDLMAQLNLPSVRDRFLQILAQAKSNRRELGSGADIYKHLVEPLRSSAAERVLT